MFYKLAVLISVISIVSIAIGFFAGRYFGQPSQGDPIILPTQILQPTEYSQPTTYPFPTDTLHGTPYPIGLTDYPNAPREGCKPAGCSSQLCVDESIADDTVTTCEYRMEYACTKLTVCERQLNGECGWTETSSYIQCLENPEDYQNF